MSEHETFGERLRQAIQTPGTGARLNAASGGGGADAGQGTHAEATTRPDEEGRTKKLWLMGDPWTDEYFFGEWKPLGSDAEEG